MMKKIVGVTILFIAIVLSVGDYKKASAMENASIAITKENFPDKRVREKIAKAFDKNRDNVLSKGEVQGAKELVFGDEMDSMEGTIKLKGISRLTCLTKLIVVADKIENIPELEKMPQLVYLQLDSQYDNNKIKPLDFRNNINLVELRVSAHDGDAYPIKIHCLPNKDKLESLTLEYCEIEKTALNDFSVLDALPVLKKVSFLGCNFQTLTIKNCPKLEKIFFDENKKLKKIMIKNLPKLEKISSEENKKLEKVTLKNLPELIQLKIGSTSKLKKLTVPKLPSLERMYIGNVKNLRTLTLSSLPELRKLKIGNSVIKKIAFKKTTSLRELDVKGNRKITKLDLRPLRKLNKFTWERGKLKKIKFGEKKNLEYMYISHNQLGGTWKLSKFPKLTEFECSYNKIKNIYARNHKHLQELICEHNRLKKLDLYNIEPYTVHFKGNPHVTAYLREEFVTTKYVSKRWSYRFDKSAKVHYKEPWR